MFHIELRQSSHSVRRLNLTEGDLREALIEPWVQGRHAQIGERDWDPQVTQITVIEGPEIEVGRMTMGRGWSVAGREGSDVSAQVLAAIEQRRAAVQPASPASSPGFAPAPLLQTADTSAAALPGSSPSWLAPSPLAQSDTLADALAMELLRRLGDGAISLNAAWRLAAERHAELGAGESLTLAAHAIASLTRSGMASLLRREHSAAGPPTPAERPLSAAEAESVLRAIDSWTQSGDGADIWLRRS